MSLNGLPENWEVKKLGDVCELVGGGTPSRTIPAYFGGKILWLTPTEIDRTSVLSIFDSREKITDLGLRKSSARIIPKGSVLLTSRATIGNVAIAGVDVTTNQGFSSFICPRNLLNKYLAYWLKRSKKKLIDEARGTTFKEISKTTLREFDFPLPPIGEQNRIVAKIEELFSELDAGVESLKKAQAQLKTYRQAVLKSAFEGKLTNQNVPDGELPKGWKEKTLGDVVSSVEYGSAAKSEKSGKVPVLRMGNIQNGRFDWSDLVFTNDDGEIEKYLLKKNDVLFNRTNSPEWVGKTAIFKGERKAIFAGYLIRINRIEALIDANYLTYFLNSHDAKIYGNSVRTFGVNQANINGTKLKTYPLKLCSLEEQRRIVEEIESRLSVCDKLEETIAASLKQSEALRQSILKQAFEGRFV